VPNGQEIGTAPQAIADLDKFRCARRLSRASDTDAPISGRSAELMRPSPLLIDNQIKAIDEQLDYGGRRRAFPFGVFEALGQIRELGNRLARQTCDRPGTDRIAVVDLKAQVHDSMPAG
jgi:hypothetical protein